MKIQQSTISLPSKWGLPTTPLLETRGPQRSQLMVVFPGSNYMSDAPLLRYARRVGLEKGWDVLSLEYGFQANRAELRESDMATLVEEAMAAVASLSNQYGTMAFVSKSLGTVVASHVQKALSMSQPMRDHIFLTPLVSATATMRQTDHALVVVGSADPYFGPQETAAMENLDNVELHIVPQANHALEVDSYIESLRILHNVTQWCAEFLGQCQKSD